MTPLGPALTWCIWPLWVAVASPYNVWIHWLQKEEADQFAKRGKADFKPHISLKTAQRTMQTFKLGYQTPMKDTCAKCELYNLQTRTTPPALQRRIFSFSKLCGTFFLSIFRPNFATSRPRIYRWPAKDMTGTNTTDSTACRRGVEQE